MSAPQRGLIGRVGWQALRALHHADFRWLLPAVARLPLPLGFRLAALRGRINAAAGRDWRSVALGFRHIRAQSAQAYRTLATVKAEDATNVSAWTAQRFEAEARDEFEAQLVAAHRVDALQCTVAPQRALSVLKERERGLVLLTPHFESFFLGVAFLARGGAKVNLMSSAITHDPRVGAAVQRHFTGKYRGLERYLNGGRVVDLESGARQFYRMLQNRECLVVLGDAPVLPDGAGMDVEFLGGRRLLSGGPVRMARATGSDLGAFLCRPVGSGRYTLEMGPLGPAVDPATVTNVYQYFSDAILRTPGGWWGADLLVNMPLAPASQPEGATQPQARDMAAPDFETLLISDSPLAGSGELALGLRQLRTLLDSREKPRAWHAHGALEVPPPGAMLSRCAAPHLLVLLHPELIATAALPGALAAALASAGAACAVSADQTTAEGEWAAGYSTQADVERYVDRRQALPPHTAWNASSAPVAYLLDVAKTRAAIQERGDVSWQNLPSVLDARTVQAERAYVHSYRGYQQGTREEMLALLPLAVARLLDVGGGEGRFARAFVEKRGGEAWVVEPSEAILRGTPIARLTLIRGTLEDLDPAQSGTFDAVSLLDVLEHMAEPLEALRTARRFLRPGGLLLVSVPNIGHWSVVRDLAQGRFDYLPVGILCTTHLRFFTRASLEQLLAEAGFKAVEWRHAGPPMPAEFEKFMQSAQPGTVNRKSLETESLHVLAVLD